MASIYGASFRGGFLNPAGARAETLNVNTRYCPTCAVEVEDADGFCLLGHSLRAAPVTVSMEEFRAGADQAFAAALAEPANNGRSPAPNTPPPNGARRPPAPPAQNGRHSPPPPPTATTTEHTMPTMWQAFEDELAGTRPIESADPISQFAPSPRMDWGPERPGLLRRSSFQRRPSGASA